MDKVHKELRVWGYWQMNGASRIPLWREATGKDNIGIVKGNINGDCKCFGWKWGRR
jgi:hypothetical protein